MSTIPSASMSLEHQPRSMDPFTVAYQRVCEGLWRHHPLAQMVKPGNRISRIVGTGKPKNSVNVADTPEVDILPGQWGAHLFATSSGSMVTRYFPIVIRTGKDRLDDGLFPLEWEFIRSLANLQVEFGIDIGIPNVVNVTLEDFNDISGGAVQEGLPGWVTVGRIRVDFNFRHAVAASTEGFTFIQLSDPRGPLSQIPPIEAVPLWDQFKLDNIDGTQTGAHQLGTTRTGRGQFIVTEADLYISALTNFSDGPTVSFGTNATDYDNIVPATPTGALVVKEVLHMFSFSLSQMTIDPGGAVFLNISGAATADVLTLSAIINGYYLGA